MMIILSVGMTRELEQKFFLQRFCFSHLSSSFINATKANGYSVGHFVRASCRTGSRNCSYIKLMLTTTSALLSLEHLASRPNTHQVSRSAWKQSIVSADRSVGPMLQRFRSKINYHVGPLLGMTKNDLLDWLILTLGLQQPNMKRLQQGPHHSNGWLIETF